MAQYYLVKDKQRVGPFDVAQLLQNGLTPDSLVWCEGMANWTKASEVAELATALAPAPPVTPVQPATPAPPVAPAPPAVQPVQPQAQQQPQWQAQPQQPQWQGQPQQVPAPVPANNQNVFKIILYVLLGLSGLGAIFTFFGSFAYFGGWFNRPLLGISSMLSSAAIIGICVVSIMRMVKNEKFAFLTIGYFAVAFIINILGLILASGYGGFGAFSFITGLAGLAVAVLASIPMDKVGDVNSYKALLAEATPIDYVLLGVYALFSLISMFSIMSLAKSLSMFRL